MPPRSSSVLRGKIGDAVSGNRFERRLHLQVQEQRSTQRAARADSVCTTPNPANPPFIPSPASASCSLTRADHGGSSQTNEGHLGVGVALARRVTEGGLTVSPRLHLSLVWSCHTLHFSPHSPSSRVCGRLARDLSPVASTRAA